LGRVPQAVKDPALAGESVCADYAPSTTVTLGGLARSPLSYIFSSPARSTATLAPGRAIWAIANAPLGRRLARRGANLGKKLLVSPPRQTDSSVVIRVAESPAAAERLTAAGAFVQGFPPATEVLIVGASREAVGQPLGERPRAHAHAQGALGLAQRDLGRQDISAVLAAKRLEVSAAGRGRLRPAASSRPPGHGAGPPSTIAVACFK
jgi:hypothetical protein